MTLTDFLLARIAEDEAGNGCYGEGEYETCFRRSERIGRECEAKRTVVERLSAEQKAARALPPERQVDGATIDWIAEDCLSQLALPYADHPDYREKWRP